PRDFLSTLSILLAKRRRTAMWPRPLPRRRLGATLAEMYTSASEPLSSANQSRLLDLDEIQFDRRRSPEDTDQNSHLTFVALHLFHRPVVIGEGTVDDLHALADIEENLRLRTRRTLGHLVGNLAHFRFRDRIRLGGAADETRHLGRRLDDVPGFVVQLHLHQDVPRKEHPRG